MQNRTHLFQQSMCIQYVRCGINLLTFMVDAMYRAGRADSIGANPVPAYADTEQGTSPMSV